MAHIDTHKCMNLDSNKQQTVTDHNIMEHISLTHAQHTKTIRTVSVCVCRGLQAVYTKQSVLQTLRIKHLPKSFLVYIVPTFKVQFHYYKAVTNYTSIHTVILYFSEWRVLRAGWSV